MCKSRVEEMEEEEFKVGNRGRRTGGGEWQIYIGRRCLLQNSLNVRGNEAGVGLDTD